MYARHFGLDREPFSIAPDPRFLYMSARHREALAHLLYGLGGGGGFVLLTGEIGAGKTTVCRAFLEQVPEGTRVAYLFNPRLTAVELLQTVCDEFGVQVPGDGLKARVDALNAFLLRVHAEGGQCVLVIDEAQSLSADVLEQLRLLTNLETAERKLLQIILIGQPELRGMLARPELEQLAQRVIARWHLGALDPSETGPYVRHRFAVAGGRGALPFDERALRRLHALSGGVPRRINLLADRALLGAYANGANRVGVRLVEQAAAEVFDRKPASRGARLAAGAGALVLIASAAGMAWTAWQHTAERGGSAGEGAGAAARGAGPAATAGAGLPTTAAAAPASAAAASGAHAAPDTTADASTAGRERAAASTVDAFPWSSEPVDAGLALSRLAAAWGVDWPADARCEASAGAALWCHRTQALTLATIRALDRPGVVTLQRDGDAPQAMILAGLADDAVLLQWPGRPDVHRLALTDFGTTWRGDFGTFWRPLPVAPPVPASWAGGQIARLLPGTDRVPLNGRVQIFQRAHGLQADGIAGTLTLMQLGRALGADEPRLTLSSHR